jgi:hypothetical protein
MIRTIKYNGIKLILIKKKVKNINYVYYTNTYGFRAFVKDKGLVIEMRRDMDFEPFITELKQVNIQSSNLYSEIINMLNNK